MAKLGTWKRTAVAAAAVASIVTGAGFSVALAESHGASAPGHSVRAEGRRAELPRMTLPMTVRSEETTYRVTGDECVGSVCAKGVAVTAPAVEASDVGGTTTTPTVELAVGHVGVSVTEDGGSVGVSAHYGAIGGSYEVELREVLPRH